MSFREGSEHDYILVALFHPVDRTRVDLLVLACMELSVIGVRLVQRDHYVRRHALDESIQLVGVKHRPGRIIWICDVHDAGIRSNRRHNAIEIEPIVPSWDLDQLSAGCARYEGVDDE